MKICTLKKIAACGTDRLGANYTFTDELGKRSFTVSGAKLAAEGFSDKLPHRSGVIWFYTKNN